MSIAESFYTFITASTAIDAVISDRIYPHIISQAALKAELEKDTPGAFLTYSQEVGEWIDHLSGVSDTRRAEIQTDSWAIF